jgi:type VI protein secretion system component VasK
MYPILIAVVLLTLWAWKTGRLKRADTGDFAAIAAVVLGLRWLATGNGIFALICFSGVALWAAYRSQQFRRARMPVTEARELLGVPDDADQETIRAAHRRLIAKVHPDAGGSADLARRVNAAREILLSEIRNRVPERRD